jgi:hypothetical protein
MVMAALTACVGAAMPAVGSERVIPVGLVAGASAQRPDSGLGQFLG